MEPVDTDGVTGGDRVLLPQTEESYSRGFRRGHADGYEAGASNAVPVPRPLPGSVWMQPPPRVS